jgi:(p)ppGpp synthase/HD superfamily hydrolase
MTPAEQLTRWVADKHQYQRIKKTGQPYFTHLVAVAEMAASVTFLGFEIGLCHDLLEDTGTTAGELLVALRRFNYDAKKAAYITLRVAELTDVFTSAAYPGLSKGARKEKEALRLYGVSAGAQTVKYCDLIDNIKWVLKHDQKHAAGYLQKKDILLAGMNKGDQGIRQKALDMIHNGLKD